MNYVVLVFLPLDLDVKQQAVGDLVDLHLSLTFRSTSRRSILVAGHTTVVLVLGVAALSKLVLDIVAIDSSTALINLLLSTVVVVDLDKDSTIPINLVLDTITVVLGIDSSTSPIGLVLDTTIVVPTRAINDLLCKGLLRTEKGVNDTRIAVETSKVMAHQSNVLDITPTTAAKTIESHGVKQLGFERRVLIPIDAEIESCQASVQLHAVESTLFQSRHYFLVSGSARRLRTIRFSSASVLDIVAALALMVTASMKRVSFRAETASIINESYIV